MTDTTTAPAVASADDQLCSLISAAVARRMTPDFIEKEVQTRVDKLIVESVDRALRSYSDTGKLIEKAIEEALRVDRLDLPSYGATVASMLKTQIEARVAPLIAGQLAADMDELLNLAPKEVKLSDIAAFMLKPYEDDNEWGKHITVHVESKSYGGTWISLDDDQALEGRDLYKAKFRLLVDKDGRISGFFVGGREASTKSWIGSAYGIEQKLRAYTACGTKLIIDEDAVITSVGDY
ncbi:hypothetical protein [Sphingomonas azotifigens]|uniref:hypothetical protein n=1 Tax=Sphingomonas azotifigens TaxID=330920 RepID=UPI000A064A52|nr:hypothetical protein [Sphingomonas azotifigens]